jgi:hypothetical protein
MEGTNSNTISVADASFLSGGEATTDSGGMAYMTGLNNYVYVLNGGIISQCTAKRKGGCFYFAGT